MSPVFQDKGGCLLVGWTDTVLPDWFDARRFDLHAEPVSEGGRGSAWFVDIHGQACVLRLYRRGGMISRLSKNLYWWAGRDKVRSLQEFQLLARLSDQGLKVPRPVAAMACRTKGFFYTAALITERIPHSRALHRREERFIWNRAGRVIANMHKMGVWHADLNVNNILVDANDEVWLIDFDKAESEVTDPKRLHGNLDRLERSVLKVCPDLHATLWPMLLSGYAQAAD